jgi:hypothetical protein
MADLQAITQKSLHGVVYPISKPDFTREVTEASKKGPVLVNLTSSLGTNVGSRILTELWRQAAKEYGEIKFCEIKGDQAIEGYPDRNCPTILIYNKGEIVKQVVTLAMVGGVRMSMKNVDYLLLEIGAIRDNDMRVVKRRRQEEDEEDAPKTTGIRDKTRQANVEDDDDWD